VAGSGGDYVEGEGRRKGQKGCEKGVKKRGLRKYLKGGKVKERG
jgi:hypothetical protein